MANKNDFTPEEWTKVLESIIAAGIAVSAVDPSGWWGTLKEAAAGTPALAAAKRDPNSNELIKAAVAAFERSNDGSILAMRERFAQAEPTECVQRSFASLREVSATVDAKAPDEAAAFKTWLREISQKVAEAAVEGYFLGFGGVRVSDAETATLRDISKALGIASLSRAPKSADGTKQTCSMRREREKAGGSRGASSRSPLQATLLSAFPEATSSRTRPGNHLRTFTATRAEADTAKGLTMNQARRIASNIAKLPHLLGKGD